ncbi:MAG TPA: hypothetical protein VGE86_11465 [Thermoanaerobaculia bacterium]
MSAHSFEQKCPTRDLNAHPAQYARRQLRQRWSWVTPRSMPHTTQVVVSSVNALSVESSSGRDLFSICLDDRSSGL